MNDSTESVSVLVWLTKFPDVVLAAGVLAALNVSFLLVGSAALWLRGEPIGVGDVDAVIEPGEQNLLRLHAALIELTIRPGTVTPQFKKVNQKKKAFMGESSGVGLVELAILDALDARRAWPNRRYVNCLRVLLVMENEIGLARGYGYQVLIDVAVPWKLPIPLVEPQGNFGGQGSDPPASPHYTGARLSPVGQVALAAERGEIAPVPIGLINGNTHRQGTRHEAPASRLSSWISSRLTPIPTRSSLASIIASGNARGRLAIPNSAIKPDCRSSA